MKRPVQLLGDKMAEESSRRGFLSLLGKTTLGVAALLAGVSTGSVQAACGGCPQPCCSEPSCGLGYSQYAGCCKLGSYYWVTMACFYPDGTFNCYYVYQTGNGCPGAPEGGRLPTK